MQRILIVGVLLLLAFGCSTSPTQKAETPPEKTFFDAATIDNFKLYVTTQQEVRKALGEPYPDPYKSDNRWTYMYTFKRQIIIFFRDGILQHVVWSEKYGI